MKWLVFTQNARGSMITSVSSEPIAIRLCLFAMENLGSTFAFYCQ